MKLAAVLLDVGGVLLLPSHRRIRDALRRAGCAVETEMLDQAHYAGIRAWDEAWLTQNDPRRSYFEAYVRAAGASPNCIVAAVAAVDTAFNRPTLWSRPVPGAVSTLRSLGQAGVPVVIVSNTEHGQVAPLLAARRICQVGPGPAVPVRAIIDSYVVGVEKPERAIFELALRAIDATPNEVVHVGDSVYADVIGAQRAGMAALHFDPLRLCDRDDHEHLRDLPRLVGLMDSRSRLERFNTVDSHRA